MEGYLQINWGKLGIDKDIAIGKRLFIIRMTTLEQRDAIIAPINGVTKGGDLNITNLRSITKIRIEIFGGKVPIQVSVRNGDYN